MARTKAAGAARAPFASGHVSGVTFTVGTETGGNTIVVQCQLKDRGRNSSVRTPVLVYLSDNADGEGIIATAPSGAVTAPTGAILDISGAAKKAFLAIPNDNGRFDLQIIEAGAKTLRVCVVMPDGSVKITTVTFA